MTDMCSCRPFLFEAVGLTVSSTSCPSIVRRDSIKRPVDTGTGWQHISVDTWACVVPNSLRLHPGLSPALSEA